MRYGKVKQGNWTIEFRFNWRDNRYDVFAYQGDKEEVNSSEAGAKIGAVWKDPRKSRKKPSWTAFCAVEEAKDEVETDYGQMREAGLALLDAYTNSGEFDAVTS